MLAFECPHGALAAAKRAPSGRRQQSSAKAAPSTVCVFPKKRGIKSNDNTNNDQEKNDPAGRVVLVLLLFDCRADLHV